MSIENQKRTAFVTNRGVFCDTSKPFGLKDDRVTYQPFVNKLFHNQIDRNMEDYVNDLLVKSWTVDSFISDLREVFEVLWDSHMMLNPKKYVIRSSWANSSVICYLVVSMPTPIRSKLFRIWHLLCPSKMYKGSQVSLLPSIGSFPSLLSVACHSLKLWWKLESLIVTTNVRKPLNNSKSYSNPYQPWPPQSLGRFFIFSLSWPNDHQCSSCQKRLLGPISSLLWQPSSPQAIMPNILIWRSSRSA